MDKQVFYPSLLKTMKTIYYLEITDVIKTFDGISQVQTPV